MHDPGVPSANGAALEQATQIQSNVSKEWPANLSSTWQEHEPSLFTLCLQQKEPPRPGRFSIENLHLQVKSLDDRSIDWAGNPTEAS